MFEHLDCSVLYGVRREKEVYGIDAFKPIDQTAKTTMRSLRESGPCLMARLRLRHWDSVCSDDTGKVRSMQGRGMRSPPDRLTLPKLQSGGVPWPLKAWQ